MQRQRDPALVFFLASVLAGHERKDGKQDFVDWHRRKNHMKYEIDFIIIIYIKGKKTRMVILTPKLEVACLVKLSLGENKNIKWYISEIGVILVDSSKSQINQNLNQNNLGSNNQERNQAQKAINNHQSEFNPLEKPDLNPHSKPLRAKRKLCRWFPHLQMIFALLCLITRRYMENCKI